MDTSAHTELPFDGEAPDELCCPITLALLSLLKEQPLTGRQAVHALLEAQGIEANEAAVNGGLGILQQWQQQGLVLGAATC